MVEFDLVDEGYEGFNKFIPYYLYPETTYTVALTRGSQRTKISVGSNPWSPRPRTHNIAKICERYGGGGHAVVGAISLKPDEVEKGRAIMKEIIAELSSPPTSVRRKHEISSLPVISNSFGSNLMCWRAQTLTLCTWSRWSICERH